MVIFMNYAKNLPLKLKINFEKGMQYGKWLLRKAYENVIPNEVIWRAKMALEKGAGSESLQNVFGQRISNEEFREKRRTYFKRDDVCLLDKEQLFYYEIFRNKHGSPLEAFPEKNGKHPKEKTR